MKGISRVLHGAWFNVLAFAAASPEYRSPPKQPHPLAHLHRLGRRTRLHRRSLYDDARSGLRHGLRANGYRRALGVSCRLTDGEAVQKLAIATGALSIGSSGEQDEGRERG